jgi:hypothetical protein
MLRCLSILLLPAVLLLTTPTPASAQFNPPGSFRGARSGSLAGRYVSKSNGAACYVHRRRNMNGYTFINDHGSWAWFVFDGRRGPWARFVQVAGQWDPAVVCTVTQDRLGRTVLRFTSPNAAPGYWLKVG